MPNRINYRTTEGTLAYYEVVNLVDYRYIPFSHNKLLLTNNIRLIATIAAHNNRVYFVAHELSGICRVYCLVFEGGIGWSLINLSLVAMSVGSQLPSEPYGEIAVSPDGKTIAYYGFESSYLCYYTFTGSGYTFDKCSIYKCRKDVNGNYNPPYDYGWKNSLQFCGNGQAFCASYFSKTIYVFKFQEDYCNNKIIKEVE